jgi:hypothetical protein
MLESLRKQPRARPGELTAGATLGNALSGRLARAALAGAAMLALQLLALEARVFSGLPGYPAAALVFLSMVIVPGLLLHDALIRRSRADVVERLGLAFPFGMAVVAPAGLAALWLNLSLDTFLRLHIAVATAAGAGSVFLAPPAVGVWLSRTARGWNASALVLGLLAAVAAGGILSSPYWAAGRLARTFDEWRYMTYVNSYLQRAHIDSLHPVGLGEEAYPRMLVNVWVVLQAGIARAAGVSAESIVMDHMTPFLIVFALMATYALAKGLFRVRSVALLAVLIQVGYALIDMSHDEGLGATFLFRMGEDKMVGTYILFPIGLLLAAQFFRQARASTLAGFALVGLALFVVHPQPLLFLGVALLLLAFFRSASTRSWRPLLWAVALGLPLAGFTAGQFVVWHAFNTSWPAFFDTTLTWREEFKIVHLSGGMIMGNFHLILHPLMIGSLVVAPFVLWRARRLSAHQALLAAMIGWLPWFFVPPLSTLAAKLASAELTARLPFMAPVAIVWAYAICCYRPSRSLLAKLPVARIAAPAVSAVVLLSAALLVQDLYYPADHGTYYTWGGGDAIVKGTQHSIFLGGKDRLLSREWRIDPQERELIGYLEAHAPPGAVVLAPSEVSLHLPGVLWQVRPVYSQAIIGQWRVPPVMNVYQGKLSGEALAGALRESRVRYAVATYSSSADAALSQLSNARLAGEFGRYELYEIGTGDATMNGQ